MNIFMKSFSPAKQFAELIFKLFDNVVDVLHYLPFLHQHLLSLLSTFPCLLLPMTSTKKPYPRPLDVKQTLLQNVGAIH
jgi:hypothetical protein